MTASTICPATHSTRGRQSGYTIVREQLSVLSKRLKHRVNSRRIREGAMVRSFGPTHHLRTQHLQGQVTCGTANMGASEKSSALRLPVPEARPTAPTDTVRGGAGECVPRALLRSPICSGESGRKRRSHVGWMVYLSELSRLLPVEKASQPPALSTQRPQTRHRPFGPVIPSTTACGLPRI